MNKREAKKLTGEIRSKANDLDELVIRAYDEEAWYTLGYNSFEQWSEAEFTQGYIRLIPEERENVVLALSRREMSNVAIGQSLGISEGTVRTDKQKAQVRNDQDQVRNDYEPDLDNVVGMDGKRYPAQREWPKPKPDVVIDPEARPYPLPANYCGGRYEGAWMAFRDMNREFKSLTTNPTFEQLAKLERWLNNGLRKVNKLQEVIKDDATTA
jgi:DNA-binding CsgD family transcriptional regulator